MILLHLTATKIGIAVAITLLIILIILILIAKVLSRMYVDWDEDVFEEEEMIPPGRKCMAKDCPNPKLGDTPFCYQHNQL